MLSIFKAKALPKLNLLPKLGAKHLRRAIAQATHLIKGGLRAVMRKGITTMGVVLVVLGFVGLLTFGALLWQSYNTSGLNTLTGMADAVGLLISIIIIFFGYFAKVQ
jgi:hypothetical protein